MGTAARERSRSVPIGLALAAVPFVAALVGLGRHHWFLTGDWASIDLRIGEVGTRDTPLVGPYSTHGWAHPGPLLYVLATPLHWLSGGSPQSLSWTAALVNLASIATVARVAAKRLGPGFALAAMVATALATHGLGPGRIVDIWNPLLPLFPLLAATALAWSGATGHRRHGAAALVVAGAVAQAHVGMVPVLAVLGAWAVAWWFLVQRPDERRAGVDAEPAAAGPERWRGPLLVAAAITGVLWIPPVLDQLWGEHNLSTLARYFTSGDVHSIGLRDGVSLVGRYVRPDGPWIGGSTPSSFGSVTGGGAAPVLALAVLLVLAAGLAWRRGDRLVAAGTSQALVLLVGAGAVAGKIEQPVWNYLVQWLVVVAAWAWLWVAWGAWCLLRPRLGATIRSAAQPVALVGLALVALWSVPAALDLHPPAYRSAPAVEALRPRLERRLDRNRIVHLEHRGDDLGEVASGLIYWLHRDGYRVVSSDGSIGLKYGPDVAWHPGEPDGGAVYTVAVHEPATFRDAPLACSQHPGARLVAAYHQLPAADRAWLRRFQAKEVFDPKAITPAEEAKGTRLGEQDLRVEVWRADEACAPGP